MGFLRVWVILLKLVGVLSRSSGMPRHSSSVAAALLAVSVPAAAYAGSQAVTFGQVEITGPVYLNGPVIVSEDGEELVVDIDDVDVPTTDGPASEVPASLPFDDSADNDSADEDREGVQTPPTTSATSTTRPTVTNPGDGYPVTPTTPTSAPGGSVPVSSSVSSTSAPVPPTTLVRPPSTAPGTTEAPRTTTAPTIEVPTTQAPTTQAPTTQAPTTAAPTTTAAPRPPAPGSDRVFFGPWVESQHVDEVFGRFSSGQLNVTTGEVVETLAQARAAGSSVYLQLGSEGQYGVNFADRSKSLWTMAKWKRAIDGFAKNSTYRAAIQDAIDDGTIASVYLIDEPKLVSHWGTRISNADIDEMARYVESYWPNASTTVRASARTMQFAEPNSEFYDWKYLDNNWIMINYTKWAKQGNRTLEGFFEREVKAANNQGLGTIFSHQLIIGNPDNPRLGVDCPYSPTSPQADECSSRASSGNRNAMSPSELRTYTEAMVAKRDVNGVRSASGESVACAVLVFRWDRNGETLWQNPRYDAIANELNATAAATEAADCGNRNTGPANSSQDKRN